MRHLLLLSLLLLTTRVSAQFSGQGSGTEKDPYQVSNADELFEVRNDLSAYYIQTSDIDLTDFIAEDNPSAGWSPIGNYITPFTGSFNGNRFAIRGLYINRPNTDNNVGLFGYARGAIIKSTIIISPRISGNSCAATVIGGGTCTIKDVTIINPTVVSNGFAGGVIGELGTSDSEISNCVLLNGLIKGKTCGSVVGFTSIPASKHTINNNYANAQIEGDVCGGIIGEGRSRYYNSKNCRLLSICKNHFCGYINGTKYVGGIIGCSTETDGYNCYVRIINNIVSGTMFSSGSCGGIITHEVDNLGECSNNVAVLDTISGNIVTRITNNISSTGNNFASSAMIIITNGKQIIVDDDLCNGISYGMKMLKKRTTYEGIGFDFTNDWNMIDNESFPYHRTMTSPCSITSFNAGSKAIIEGEAKDANKVFVFVNDNLYETFVVDGKWSVSLGNIKKGTIAKISVMSEGKQPSICVEAIAEGETVADDTIIGDANGDGVVDAADVVGTINYILGKPSSSFNNKNADINDDGQILVDDAVGTVNIIMSNQ